MKEPKFRYSRLIWAYVALVGFVLLVQLSLHFLPGVIAREVPAESLQGTWEYCWLGPVVDIDNSCKWGEVRFPGSVPKPTESQKAKLLLRRSFNGIDSCPGAAETCSLFVGTVSDPATFYIDDVVIGKVASPGKIASYTQTFPVTIPVPASLLANPSKTLLIEMVPNYIGNQGLIRGPIHIFSTATAAWVSRLVIAQTIALPLISGVILLVIFFAVLLVAIASNIWDAKIVAFLGYSLAMSIYLVSLTRLPREVLSPQFGIGLHFGLRMLTEYFHLGLVGYIFSRHHLSLRWARAYCLILAFVLIFSPVPSMVGLDWPLFTGVGRTLYRFTVALFVMPPLLAVIAILAKPANERLLFVPIAFLYSVVCVMIASDFLAINGLAEDIYFVRFYPVLIALGYCSALWMSYSQMRREREVNVALGELSSRVAHDIRSPLSALNYVTGLTKELDIEERSLLAEASNRINEIANSLLDKGRQMTTEIAVASYQLEPKPHLVVAIIDKIIREKQVEFSRLENVGITTVHGDGVLDVFAKVDASELKRVLSNLINNSVDACGNFGQVSVSTNPDSHVVLIIISDNGKGIPPRVIEKLGSERISCEKPRGNGLGIHSAHQLVKSWGGKINFDSKVGSGTTCTISLPRAEPPSWWVSELDLANRNVVVVDGDLSIRELWRKRLPEGVITKSFGNPTDFISWWIKQDREEVLVLVDQNFSECELKGIQIIEQMGIRHCAVLVTSSFDASEVVSECEYYKISMIPKYQIPWIRIKSTCTAKLDALLIDDDLLVRTTWMLSADRAGKKLMVSPTWGEASSFLEKLPRGVPVYVDYFLGGSSDGLWVSKQIREMGFGEVYLTTGAKLKFEASEYPWLTGTQGKDPPWPIARHDELRR